MVARLLEKEQLALHARAGCQATGGAPDGGTDVPVLRQLLLTASPRLCQSIRRVVRRTRAVLAAKAREQATQASGDDKAQADEVMSTVPRDIRTAINQWLMCVCAVIYTA